MNYTLDCYNFNDGTGFTRESDDIKEIEGIINSIEGKRTKKIIVHSLKHDGYIYYKDYFIFEPEINFLNEYYRDLRYKEGISK